MSGRGVQPSSRLPGAHGRLGSARGDDEWQDHAPNSARSFSLAKPPRGQSPASSRYAGGVAQGGVLGAIGGGAVQFGGVAHVRQMQPPRKFASPPRLDVHEEGSSRVRGGLIAARAQAALLDSLDLDSPAHRNNAKAEACRHFGDDNASRMQLRQSQSVVESLDLNADDSAGHLKGLIRADQWLKRAVDTALGANAQPPTRRVNDSKPTTMHSHNMRPVPPSSAQGGRQMQGGVAVQFGQAAASTREVSRAATGRPPVSGQCVLRKSAELLQKHSGDTWQLLQQYRNHPAAEQGGRRQPERAASSNSGQQQQQQQQRTQFQDIDEQIQEVEDEEALLMASLARLDSKLAGPADSAAAYLAAAEYKDKQQQRCDTEVAREREARAAPLAVKKLPPAPALNHWNRNEDLQQFNMQKARDQGGGGGGAWDGSSNWGTAQSGRRPGAIQRVERVTPALGAAAKDRRTMLKNK